MLLNKMMMGLMMFLICFSVNAFAMPPHPDLLEMHKNNETIYELQSRMAAMKLKGMDSPRKSFTATGTKKVLVILVGFSDRSINEVSTIDFYDKLFNGGGSTTLTWRKYYQDMSNNQLNLSFTIVSAGNAPNTLDYYGRNSGSTDMHPAELVKEAVKAAHNLNPSLNFADFDNITKDGKVDSVIISHAGRGEESGAASNTIWSHQWSLSSAGVGTETIDGVVIDEYTIQPEYVRSPGDSTIGVFVHEFGHLIGLNDLYDTTYETNGVGKWSVMGGGLWNGPGNSPALTKSSLAAFNGVLGLLLLISCTAAMFFVKNKGVKKTGTLLVLFISTLFFLDLGCKPKPNNDMADLLLLLFISGLNSSVGSVPAPLLAWEKAKLGWLTPTTPSVPATNCSLPDIETNYQVIKVVLSGNQYLMIENKVKTVGTWTEYLPGDGLLITHIDDSFITSASTYNEINSNYIGIHALHGVEIEEADGNFALWDATDNGSATDTYYSGNKTSITPYTTPNTNYNIWSGIHGSYSFTGVASSGVYVDNISAKGSPMTFNVHK